MTTLRQLRRERMYRRIMVSSLHRTHSPMKRRKIKLLTSRHSIFIILFLLHHAFSSHSSLWPTLRKQHTRKLQPLRRTVARAFYTALVQASCVHISLSLTTKTAVALSRPMSSPSHRVLLGKAQSWSKSSSVPINSDQHKPFAHAVQIL